MRRWPPLPAAVALMIAVPAVAGAQATTVPAEEAGAAAPAPQPLRGTMKLALLGVHRLDDARVALQGTRWRVRGVVNRYVPGQVVTVRFTRGGESIKTVKRFVHRVRGSRKGEYFAELTAAQSGRVRVRAVKASSARMVRLVARAEPVEVILPRAGWPARGLRVKFLQQRLRKLGYWSNVTGVYDGPTQLAVLAFRKTNGLSWTTSANPEVFERVAKYKGMFKPRYRGGRHIETDLSRQILTLVNRNGKVYRTLHTSSGAPSTPTVLGKFQVYMKTPGFNSLGMLHSVYFYGGYALHGYKSVPLYNASHGCLRLPHRYARHVYDWLSYGDGVYVYR